MFEESETNRRNFLKGFAFAGSMMLLPIRNISQKTIKHVSPKESIHNLDRFLWLLDTWRLEHFARFKEGGERYNPKRFKMLSFE